MQLMLSSKLLSQERCLAGLLQLALAEQVQV